MYANIPSEVFAMCGLDKYQERWIRHDDQKLPHGAYGLLNISQGIHIVRNKSMKRV